MLRSVGEVLLAAERGVHHRAFSDRRHVVHQEEVTGLGRLGSEPFLIGDDLDVLRAGGTRREEESRADRQSGDGTPAIIIFASDGTSSDGALECAAEARAGVARRATRDRRGDARSETVAVAGVKVERAMHAMS